MYALYQEHSAEFLDDFPGGTRQTSLHVTSPVFL